MRATASARSRGDNSETSLRLALRLRSSSMHADGGGKERLEPRDVVAHVLDQLLIARGMRAMRLVDQRAAIGGAIEHDLLPPWRRQRLVIAEHALPGGARMRRLDQGIGEIAKLAFVFGELELRRLAGRRCRSPRRRASDACRRCGNRRGCGRNRRRCSRQALRRSSNSMRAGDVTEARRVRIGRHISGMSNVRCQGRRRRRRPGAVPSSGPRPPLVSSVRVRSGQREGSGRFPCPRVERHPC